MDANPPPPEQEQSFISHLIELRQRLLRAAVAVVVVTLAMLPFTREIFTLLSEPMLAALPSGSKLLATGVIAPFMVPLKVTLFAALIVALPYVLWQAWAFVAPGLYLHEKKFAGPVIVSSVAMFLLGMAYCYYFVFGVVFKFIANFAPPTVNVAPDIDAYFSFVLGMFMAFGLAFEVPIVVVLLTYFGIVQIERLKASRPYVVVGAFVLAAIFAPPDVLSQFLLALPLCVLYEVGILVARLISKRKAINADAPSESI